MAAAAAVVVVVAVQSPHIWDRCILSIRMYGQAAKTEGCFPLCSRLLLLLFRQASSPFCCAHLCVYGIKFTEWPSAKPRTRGEPVLTNSSGKGRRISAVT